MCPRYPHASQLRIRRLEDEVCGAALQYVSSSRAWTCSGHVRRSACLLRSPACPKTESASCHDARTLAGETRSRSRAGRGSSHGHRVVAFHRVRWGNVRMSPASSEGEAQVTHVKAN